MSNFLDDFESTAGGAMWDPRQKGKGNDKVFFEPGEDSFLAGWYLGTKHGVGENKSAVHEFKVKQVGNPDHLSAEIVNDKVSVWGSGVLDSNIVDNNIQRGQFIALKWLGKVTPKSGGKPYHTWDIMVPKDMTKYPPLSMSEIPFSSPPSDIPEPKEAGTKTPTAAETLNGGADDDDLPF